MVDVLQVPEVFVTRTDWAGYLKVREALPNGVRVTYHQGKLELMAPSHRHEKRKSLLGRLLEAYMLEAGLDFDCGGSTTFAREDLDQGLEPDECYYLKSFAQVCSREDADDVPPDLALEIEVSYIAIARLPLWAAMKVPEVWRYLKSGMLKILVWTDAGYEERSRSEALPDLPLEELERHLSLGKERGVSGAVRAWQAFLRGRSG